MSAGYAREVGNDGGRDRDVPDGTRADETDPTDLSGYSEFKPVAVGIAVWVVLLVLGLLFRNDLEDDGHGWWIWTAVAGIVQGIVGYLYLMRRAARLHRGDEVLAPPQGEDVVNPDSRTPGR